MDIKKSLLDNEQIPWQLACLGICPPDDLSDDDYELWLLNNTSLKEWVILLLNIR